MQAPGLHHLILTIAEPARSRPFYADLLGFDVADIPAEEGGGFSFAAGDVTVYCYPSRRPAPGDRFDETRIGLDHLAFTAPSREALDALADRLLAAGVDTQGVERFEATGNWYVAFRDPDNIQLEYWLP